MNTSLKREKPKAAVKLPHSKGMFVGTDRGVRKQSFRLGMADRSATEKGGTPLAAGQG